MTRGGKRSGAGGKKPRLPEKEKRVKINLVVHPDTAQWIKEQANNRRIGQGRIVDELIKNG
jgi:hypothetical protein